jgi:hypothetical protein
MANIRLYINLSKKAKTISNLYEEPMKFFENYFDLEPLEQQSYINHLIVNNVPYAFKHIPLLYEQIVQYLADEIGLDYIDIKLIGSAKTGFSISPKPNYGNPFSDKSDLDFSIINESLFHNLTIEFNLWVELYTNAEIVPKKAEEKYWDENLKSVTRTIKRGFIDTYKIPNRIMFSITQKINNSLFLITFKLNELHQIKNTKASVRVYKDWDAFYKQLRINTECILSKI